LFVRLNKNKDAASVFLSGEKCCLSPKAAVVMREQNVKIALEKCDAKSLFTALSRADNCKGRKWQG